MRSQLSTVAILLAIAGLSSTEQTIDPDTVTIENRSKHHFNRRESESITDNLQTSGVLARLRHARSSASRPQATTPPRKRMIVTLYVCLKH